MVAPGNSIGLIFGTVYDRNGQPASDAKVNLYSVGRLRLDGHPEGAAGSEGVYAILFEYPAAQFGMDEGSSYPFKLYAYTETTTRTSSIVTASGSETAQGYTTLNPAVMLDLLSPSLSPMQVYGFLQSFGRDASIMANTTSIAKSLRGQMKSINKMTNALSFLKYKASTEFAMIVGAKNVMLTAYNDYIWNVCSISSYIL